MGLAIGLTVYRSFFSFPDFLGVPTYAEGSLMISDEPQRAFVIQQANIHITQVSITITVQS